MAVTRDEENSIPETGSWELIWDRFAAELTSLISLNVEERLECWNGTKLGFRYVGWSFPLMNYYPMAEPAGGAGSNAAALEQFRMTVASRSEEARRASWEAKGSI